MSDITVKLAVQSEHEEFFNSLPHEPPHIFLNGVPVKIVSIISEGETVSKRFTKEELNEMVSVPATVKYCVIID